MCLQSESEFCFFSHCFNYNSVSVLSVGLVDTWSISRMQSRALRPLSKPGSRICETTATATLTTASSGSLLHCYNTVRTQKHGRKPGTKCGGRPVQGVWGPPVGSRGKAPVGGLGDEVEDFVPQKLKQFWISIYA